MAQNKQFAENLLDISVPMEENPWRYSTISFLLKGARKLAGRDIITGEYKGIEFNEQNFIDETYNSFLFTSLLHYLILLEQIGIIFVESKGERKNGILLALDNFSQLTEEKKKAIKALRNSLAHNFGLTAKGYKFVLCQERNSEIVQPASRTWNGDFLDKSEESDTIIYLNDLIEMIEGIYSELRNKIESNEITSQLSENEIKSRFTIRI